VETLTHALTRLGAAGFTRELRAAPRSIVVCDCGSTTIPSELQVMATLRFEGASNPDDQDIVIAAITPCGHAALFSSAYGSAVGLDESGVLALIRSRGGRFNLAVPVGLPLVSTSREFSSLSTPGALMSAHHLAEEVWGRLTVRVGSVDFCFEHDSGNQLVLRAGEHCDIPPSVMHHVQPAPDALFCVGFYRQRQSSLLDK
jgi:tellurite resistance-related uncharacterized protein